MTAVARPWRSLAPVAVAVLLLHGLALRGPAPGEWRAARLAPMQVRHMESEEKPAVQRIQTAQAAIPFVAKAVQGQSPRPAPVQRAVPVEHMAEPAPAADAAPAAGPPPTVATIAPPVRLRYQVTAFLRGTTRDGVGELAWRHDGTAYEARLELGALGADMPRRIQHSAGRLTPQGLAPQRFGERLRGEEAVHFDTARGKLVFSNNRPEADLQPGAQDRLSVLMQLGALIAGAPQRHPPGSTLAVQTTGVREAEVWHFTVEGEDELQLPGGTVRALRLVRPARKEFDASIELWLAPGLDYAPVRLRLTQPNGDWLEQRWSGTDRG